MSRNLPPILIDVIREKNIESRHTVSAIAVNSSGKTEFSYGETDFKIYPRSSIKSIQAMAILLSEADKKFNISDIELALASASHGGEIRHTEAVSDWLKRMNLSVADLECGAHLPSHQNSAIDLLKQEKDYSALHNNCSGKHTGMLATSLAMGESPRGYSKATHPVQILIKNIIEDYCSAKIEQDDIATDGCSIPTYFLPMKNLALGMARLGDPQNFSEKYQTPASRIYRANVENPYFVAGTDRYCTRMMSALNKKALVKTGAEGVMFACIPEQQLGVVIKVSDGATRAAELSMSLILKKLGLLDESAWENFSRIPIKNWNQIQTGSVIINSL